MTDLIDRAELIQHLNECISSHGIAHSPLIDAVLTHIKCVIKQMPTVEPKKGQWIDLADPSESKHHRHYPMCPVCNMDVMWFLGGSEDWWVYRMPNYCPNCGADMRGRTDD